MAARVARVSVKDYRSIAYCDVELEPLTLLVGPNGSGKSNFLDALRFLVHSMHAPLEQVIESRFGLRSILRKLPKGLIASSFSIRVSFNLADGTSGTYSLSVGQGSEGAAVIEEERCRVGTNDFASIRGVLTHNAHATPAFTGDRPALIAFGGFPQFAPVFNLIAGLTFYAPNPDKMRAPAPVGPGDVLSREASNAADVLARIERSKPQLTARIRGYLHSFNPEFDDVTVTESTTIVGLRSRRQPIPATGDSTAPMFRMAHSVPWVFCSRSFRRRQSHVRCP